MKLNIHPFNPEDDEPDFGGPLPDGMTPDMLKVNFGFEPDENTMCYINQLINTMIHVIVEVECLNAQAQGAGVPPPKEEISTTVNTLLLQSYHYMEQLGEEDRRLSVHGRFTMHLLSRWIRKQLEDLEWSVVD
jgi:hypothetical protein